MQSKCQLIEPAIVIHGGAINPLSKDFTNGVSEAAREGISIMEKKLSSLEAVVRAIEVMENNPIFNAGTGSWPNLDGQIEMDAFIMDGKTLKAGAVACIKMVKNPILVAKKVMEETDHILLAGEGAEKFARNSGFAKHNPLTEERKKQWEDLIHKLKRGEKLPMFEYWKKIRKYVGDTVGAVAIDSEGNISAGTSSGGFPLKLPGRVGDVPLIGCSTYASNHIGGVSITGHGEVVMRYLLAKKVCDTIAEGQEAQEAVENTIKFVNKEEKGNILLTIIAMDKRGNVGAARNVDATPHAYICKGMRDPRVNFAPIVK